ncbi:MAG TPA: hypothetical protein VMS98_02085 [Thermoanaerobaculia bacterium]|nr:hypothetical protein [Thermoanaerobaculia bacterium]
MITLRPLGLAAAVPAAAPMATPTAARLATLLRLVRAAFLPRADAERFLPAELRRLALDFFPPFLPDFDRRADVAALRFFDDFLLLGRFREEDLEALRLDDFLLEDLFAPPRLDDFFEERFFAAMGYLLFKVWGVLGIERSRCACNLVD